MKTISLTRAFKAGPTVYPDPAPERPPEEAVRMYPQFAQARVKGPVREGDRLIYTVDRAAVGTKG